jgi:hypothetical protein
VREVEARVDGGPWLPVDQVLLAGEGVREVEVRATDAAGLRSTQALEVRVDTLAPQLDAQVHVVASGARIAANATDGGSGLGRIVLQFGGKDLVPTRLDGSRAVWDVPGALPGDALAVVAEDVAGNAAIRTLRVPGGGGAPLQSTNAPSAPALTIQSVVLTPAEGSAAGDVHVTARVEGAAIGRLVLRDAAGNEVASWDAVVRNGTLRAGGPAPPGSYRAELDLVGDDGTPVTHDVGDVTVPAPPAAARTPGFDAAALAVLGGVALRRRR